MRIAHVLLLLTCSSLSLLAEVPDAPLPADPGSPAVKNTQFVKLERTELTNPNYRKMFVAAFALDTTVRALDAYSTHRALKEKGNREMFLPSEITNSQRSLYCYSASVLLSEYLGYRFFVAHHHEKIGRWLPYVDSALVLPFAIHNLTL